MPEGKLVGVSPRVMQLEGSNLTLSIMRQLLGTVTTVPSETPKPRTADYTRDVYIHDFNYDASTMEYSARVKPMTGESEYWMRVV